MTLIDEAERAEKIRNALIIFATHCADDHQAIQDINKAISELSTLSCVLREIDKLIEFDTGPGLDLIHDDLKFVHEDVTWTLQDVWDCLGRLGRRYTAEDYKATWDEITEQSMDLDEGKKLHQVLEGYRNFLASLARAIESYVFGTDIRVLSTLITSSHATTPTIEKLGDEIRGIHARRSPKPQHLPGRPVTPTTARSKSQRRSSRPRAPSRGNSSLKVSSPQTSIMKQPKSYERERPFSPDGSTASSVSGATKFREKVPWAPSPPLSPTATISSISQISSATPSLEASPGHWARQVFKNVSSTPLPWSTEETRYHVIPGITEQSHPSHLYDNVLALAYPEGVRVSLFCRPTDYRSKIVVNYRDRRGTSDYGCLPLEDLHIRREGAVIRVCRRKASGKIVPWVSMKFTTIERLVLFTSTFIAMRSQDSSTQNPAPPVHDDELRDEVCEFAGTIVDSGFTHALRIWRDKMTDAVRLQGSVFQGELDRTPVWTAFITHIIASPGWCRRIDRKTIALADLRLHIFSSRYRPHLAPSGAFMLRFQTRDDCEAFFEVIESLRMSVAGF